MQYRLLSVVLVCALSMAAPAGAQFFTFDGGQGDDGGRRFRDEMRALEHWQPLGPVYTPPAYTPPAAEDPYYPSQPYARDPGPSSEELLQRELDKWDRSHDRAREDFKAWGESLQRQRCAGLGVWRPECD